jgi:hypothetical protein
MIAHPWSSFPYLTARKNMQRTTDNVDNPPAGSANGCLLRIFWMMLGNAIVCFCAAAIVTNSTGHLSAADAFYWVTVGCLVGARYVDVRYYDGTTAKGEPATLAHWRWYTIRLVVIAAVGWLVIHATKFAFVAST